MSDNRLLHISVHIAGRSYPLTVTPDEAKAIRQIETQLHGELDEWQARYGSKLGKQDILAMLLVLYAKKVHDLSKEDDTVAIQDKITDIVLRLDHALGH